MDCGPSQAEGNAFGYPAMPSAQEKASRVHWDSSPGFTGGLPLHPHQRQARRWHTPWL